MTNRNEYNAFGEQFTNANNVPTANSIGYTGQRLDNETGLMALGNGERYYSPSYARFIQQDSFAGMPQMPQSLNRFAYANGNPNKYTDPSGHAGIIVTIFGGAAIGGVAGGALEFAHQTVDKWTGARNDYDWGAIGKAAVAGAIVGAIIGSGGLLAGAFELGAAYTVGVTIAGVGVGAATVAVDLEQGRYAHAFVDAAATLLPFAFKGVRSQVGNSFKEFGIRPTTALKPPGMVTAKQAWARIAQDTKGEIASVRKALGRGDDLPKSNIKTEPIMDADDAGIYQAAEDSRPFEVDNALKAADETAGILVNDKYKINPTATNVDDLIINPSGTIKGKTRLNPNATKMELLNGNEYMYVIDEADNLIIGTRAKGFGFSNPDGKASHPTLIGGVNPKVKAAGLVDIRGGKIYKVDNSSGHFKPSENSLQIAEEIFKNKFSENSFSKDFQGFVPYGK